MAHAQWGVVVRSLRTGELLYQRNSEKLMMPASNMKIVTLAAAAHVFGWDHRFATTLETGGRIEDGVLRGDLFIRGGGDPTINTRNGRGAQVFDQWLAALQAAGITRIDGRIVGDDQLFDDEGLGQGWAWDYLEAGYAAPVGALQYNENLVELTVLPAAEIGSPAVVSLGSGAGLELLNRAVTVAATEPETITYRRHVDRPVLEIGGNVPLRPAAPGVLPPVRTVSRQVAVVNPTLFLAHAFRTYLIGRGVSVLGDAVDLDDVTPETAQAPGSRSMVVRTESPTLREIAGVLMKVSQNLYAETLFKAMGVPAMGAGTARGGREAVARTVREWGLDDRSLVMADGSGLSRYNYVTPALLADILQRMYVDSRHKAAFRASLPIAGKDGTLSVRLRRTRAEANAAAKTGSISNVRSLSGYVETRDGEPLVFSILANGFVIPAATVNWIADLAVEVLANFTRAD